MEDFTRNMLVSFVCGLVFGLSWWLMIDILAIYPQVSAYKHGLVYLPIFLGTLSLFMNGFIPNWALSENLALTRTIFWYRCLFFVSMIMGFSGVLAAILFSALKDEKDLPVYALIGIPLLNCFILASNLTFKFGTVEESDEIL